MDLIQQKPELKKNRFEEYCQIEGGCQVSNFLQSSCTNNQHFELDMQYNQSMTILIDRLMILFEFSDSNGIRIENSYLFFSYLDDDCFVS